MLPATLQFLITMIACAINERMQRKLDYTQEEVRVLKDMLKAASHGVDRGVNERRAVGVDPIWWTVSLRGFLH